MHGGPYDTSCGPLQSGTTNSPTGESWFHPAPVSHPTSGSAKPYWVGTVEQASPTVLTVDAHSTTTTVDNPTRPNQTTSCQQHKHEHSAGQTHSSTPPPMAAPSADDATNHAVQGK